ncbi:MAG: hypothetical protein HY290_14120 [Planctomycetia bacterium]|nr:hypothetical protein [Planctomycetia bacterium]
MPLFIGARVADEHNQTLFDELYEFMVAAPESPDFGSDAVLPAFFTPDVDESHIARQLAATFGAKRAGDTVELTLLEIDAVAGTSSRFRLPIVVNFAAPERGPDYIQIGVDDLEAHFEWTPYTSSPSGDFVEIKRLPESNRICDDHAGPGVALVGNQAS